MDSELEAVRQAIRNVGDKIVMTEQKLAAAEHAHNAVKSRFDLLLSFNNQLLSQQVKENILLRSQAPSEPCLQLVHAGFPVYTSCCTALSSASPVACL